MIKTPAGVYVHIPFCVRKCEYCDFLSFSTEEKEKELGGETFLKKSFSPNSPSSKNFDGYVKGVVDEIERKKNDKAFDGGIDTVYIGGGTPTALPAPLLCEILRAVAKMPLLPGAEITVEANPGTVDAAYLAAVRACGANRLSFGVQSTHDFLLRALGRIHSNDEFLKNFYAARDVGFDNINIDLMFALPGQTTAHWRETLAEIIRLSPQHISAYSLSPAENTPLWVKLKSGKVSLPSDETDREMYHTARQLLANAGYTHYEISNFAKPGFESRHNVNCWTMRPYIGFGLGAHSFDGAARWHNPESLEGGFSPEKITLSPAEHMAEAMILGLRLICGVSEREFAARFGVAPSEVFKEETDGLLNSGLLARKQGRLALTPRGLDLANRVFEAFIP